MTSRRLATLIFVAGILHVGCSSAWAVTTTPGSPAQEMIKLPVRVVDLDGKPVAGAKIIPWALRCSQGHGSWTPKGFGDSEPPTLMTDEAGRAEVPYPRLADVEERIQTTEVTLSIDHPDFVYVMYEFINVPRTETKPHEIRLKRGTRVEIRPLLNGKPVAQKGLHVLWSGGRPSKGSTPLPETTEGALRLPTMAEGAAQLLLVRLDGERATHFSSLLQLDLRAGDTVKRDVKLRPAAKIRGKLSENVPRPVKSGRVKALTLPGSDGPDDGVEWYTWAPVAEDGSFEIDSWPADEDMQLIALCDGFHAESGGVIDLARFLPKTARTFRNTWRTGWGVSRPDPFLRPQLFTPEQQRAGVALQMKPMATVAIETVDEQGAPIAGVKVISGPNVGWWNYGSQIYGTPLVRRDVMLTRGGYEASIEKAYSEPFQSLTGNDGWSEMELPLGHQDLYAKHEAFELPVNQGRRDIRIDVVKGMEPVRLVMQPKGQEYLGEWDKLAGVLFGCTGEQCRKLLDDPGFKKQITLVRETLDNAKNPRDPKVLNAAYAEMAKAFDELNDQEEAEKWRRKANEQAAKMTAENENAK